MNFSKLIERVNGINPEDKNNIIEIVNEIDIDENNFGQWVDNIFSDQINLFDMGKLPYLIDELYKSTDKLKFMLCCMLLESTCDKLEFITNLENYPLFVAKFEALVNTLTTVYERVDNGIANCASVIIINNDPKFSYFDDELKNRIINATKRKLKDILDYLKTENINPLVYEDLEVIVDLSCYLNNQEISNIIDEIDNLGKNGNADIFIIKYKAINNMKVSNEKLEMLKQDSERLWLLYNILEKLNMNNTYLNDVSQESIAKSNMITWLKYPTELGSIPDQIELLGEFICHNTKCFAYKFSKKDFSISGELLGVSGGFPIDKISSVSTGYTFSKFENVSDDWQKQSTELVEFMINYWENRNKE